MNTQIKLFRYNDVPLKLNIDNIETINSGNNVIKVMLKNGDCISGYFAQFC